MSDQVRRHFPRTTNDQTREDSPRTPDAEVCEFPPDTTNDQTSDDPYSTYTYDGYKITTGRNGVYGVTSIIHGGERWTCLSYDPRQLNPDRFSAIGLPPEERARMQKLAVTTSRTIEEAKKLFDFLPVDYDFSRVRDNLAHAIYSIDLMLSTSDPVAYHIDNIQNWLSEVRRGCDDVKRYLAENDLGDCATRLNLYLVNYHLDKAIDAADQIASAVYSDI